ncbi:1,3-beta-glucanosyltransferase gel4 [Neoconidiobolus thromboides FSU 785]|nr:1,3-beta-glucanosyltransferase gel4 [Neoconidiobolus thromboides FSU 785]
MLKRLVVSLLVASSFALDPIIAKGNKFFNKNTGEIFHVKGIAYQPRGSPKGTQEDPLTFPDRCKRDVEYFKELGVNVIRVYEVDPAKDHKECMKIFADAGIYLALDIPIPKYSINRSKPTYTIDMLEHFTQNIDAFDQFDNVAFYFAGNEINNDKTNTDANPFVKASLRDMKAYIKTKKHQVLVGYANNDDVNTRKNIQAYFNCGKDEERADFYSVNVYSWCRAKSFEGSPYSKLAEELKGYTIPVFLSEYGCNTAHPREFVNELNSMYGPDMEEVIAGGILYEYNDEANHYGIVKIKDGKVEKINEEYDNFKKALANIKPKKYTLNDYKPENTKASTCPKVDKNWESNEKLPPTPSNKKCKCIVDSLSCKVKKTDLSGDEIAETFKYLCGKVDCKKTLGSEPSKGEYGVISACSAIDQLSWALNEVYIKENKNNDACVGENGLGEVQTSKNNIDSCNDVKEDISALGSGSENKGSSGVSFTKYSSSLLAAAIVGTYLF